MDEANPSAVSTETLRAMTGYSRAADLERWCERHGVRYFHGRRGPWTTLDACQGIVFEDDRQVISLTAAVGASMPLGGLTVIVESALNSVPADAI